jgi:hypothetical protein
VFFQFPHKNAFSIFPLAEGVKTGVFCEVATKGNVQNLTTLIFMGGRPTRGATSRIQEQFFGASTDDAAAHLNNFVELCEMQKYKDVDGDIIKLKLFPFSLRGRAKDWLLSLPRNSIDSWVKCKDAFIGNYYPPAKIIAL